MRKLLMVVIVFICGCTTHALISKLPTVELTKSAEIMVIRPNAFRGEGTVAITLDGVPIIGIRKGEHTIFRISEGEHSLGMECCPQYDVGQTYEAGKQYFYIIKVGYTNYALLPIMKLQAKSWLRNNDYIPVDDAIVYGDTK